MGVRFVVVDTALVNAVRYIAKKEDRSNKARNCIQKANDETNREMAALHTTTIHPMEDHWADI